MHRLPVASVAPVVLAMTLGACSGAANVPPRAPVDASPAGPTVARAPAAGRVPPPLTQLSQVSLEQLQGGPHPRCKGVEYTMSVDLAKNEWAYGLCLPTASGRPGPDTPLTISRGALKPEARARVEASYAKLAIAPATACADDGGALTLSLERPDGQAERYPDANWGCKAPAPEIASGLKDFANTLVMIANAP